MVRDVPPRTNDGTPSSLDRRRFLRGTVGVAAGVAAIPTFTGVAAAHFPVELEIDIQPENADDFIDLDEHDRVPVAVSPSEFLDSDGERATFDPTEEAVRYRFGSRGTLDDGEGARPVDDGEVRTPSDGHGDGSSDVLVLNFPVAETGLDSEDDAAWLYWERDESGDHGYSGVDTLSVYGGEPPSENLRNLLQRLLKALSDR